jgi:hypothetical protein
MMRSALEEVAVAADEVAADQRQVARRARAMQRRRDQGWSWDRIMEWDPHPGLLELLRRSGRRLTWATSRLAQAVASGLSGEGQSRRQVARRLSVSHQRVSAMLKGDRGPAGDRDTPADR